MAERHAFVFLFFFFEVFYCIMNNVSWLTSVCFFHCYKCGNKLGIGRGHFSACLAVPVFLCCWHVSIVSQCCLFIWILSSCVSKYCNMSEVGSIFGQILFVEACACLLSAVICEFKGLHLVLINLECLCQSLLNQENLHLHNVFCFCPIRGRMINV